MSQSRGERGNGKTIPRPFSMAFQPIVDIGKQRIYGYEALVRGPNGESAGSVLSSIPPESRYVFDQQCRVKALELGKTLGLGTDGTMLALNCLPGAVIAPTSFITPTLETAKRLGYPLDCIVFEFTEGEELSTDHVNSLIREYRHIGFKVALDDFGSGYSSLGLLAQIKPDTVKLDMTLLRGIDRDNRRVTILKHMLAMLNELGIEVIGEGVETHGELEGLRALGVDLMQGYYFAKPLLEALPTVLNLGRQGTIL